MTDPCRMLIQTVEEAGFLTSYRGIIQGSEGEEWLVCVAGRLESRGLVGRSFKVFRLAGESWAVETWCGIRYLVPNDQSISQVCIDFLRMIRTDMLVPEELVSGYRLSRVCSEGGNRAGE